MSGPQSQSKLAEGLERWYAARHNIEDGGEQATWETDKVFLSLALSLWPVDMEAAVHPSRQTSRMRLRLRWEGFRAAADVRQRLHALLETADYVRGLVSGTAEGT